MLHTCPPSKSELQAVQLRAVQVVVKQTLSQLPDLDLVPRGTTTENFIKKQWKKISSLPLKSFSRCKKNVTLQKKFQNVS
jgi:hypothetical protein